MRDVILDNLWLTVLFGGGYRPYLNNTLWLTFIFGGYGVIPKPISGSPADLSFGSGYRKSFPATVL